MSSTMEQGFLRHCFCKHCNIELTFIHLLRSTMYGYYEVKNTFKMILAFQDPTEWPLIEPLPSYGRGRERNGSRHISLIHGNGLSDVVITGLSLFCFHILIKYRYLSSPA